MEVAQAFGMRRMECIAVLTGLLLLGSVLDPAEGRGAVSGPCSDCHTMHNSQGGSPVGEGAEPNEGLLLNDCIGCHSGLNDGGNRTPYVLSSVPTYGSTGTEGNTLAGGNFYWVTQGGGDAFGHNVAGVTGPDLNFPGPPGFDGGRPAADGTIPGGGSWPGGRQVSCAGTYGCHGTHGEISQNGAIRGGHHQGTRGAITTPGTSPAGGYRMLVGVAGYEDSDWEYRPTAADHNQYKGVDDPGGADTSTISALCARCHGKFHDGPQNVGGSTTPSSSPWIRHPTDFDLGNTKLTSEYRNYGGAGVHQYDRVTPVGSVEVSKPLSTVTFSDDTVITCLSCHRAHGTPHYKMMRWDYAGSSWGGPCANCHTSKN